MDLIAVTRAIAADIVEVAAGTDFTLVRDAEGVVYGTGRNHLGQLSRSVAAETIDRFVVLHQQRLSALGLPRIRGRARCGTTLVAAPPRWSPSATRVSYQWQANG